MNDVSPVVSVALPPQRLIRGIQANRLLAGILVTIRRNFLQERGRIQAAVKSTPLVRSSLSFSRRTQISCDFSGASATVWVETRVIGFLPCGRGAWQRSRRETPNTKPIHPKRVWGAGSSPEGWAVVFSSTTGERLER